MLYMQLKTKQQILNITPYKPGKAKLAAGNNNDIIKLSSNENPYGASPKAIQAYQTASSNLHLYPDGGSNYLRNCIAEVNKINPDNIICGAGSDEVLELIAYAFCGEGDEVLYSQHGFLVYPIAAMSAGAKPVQVPEQDFTTNVDGFIKAVNDKTRIIFIANPNNPTGTYINIQELTKLCDNVPNNVLIVVDSAYAEYMQEDDYIAGIELAEKYDNVIMTRTFSKLYGLAGLRLGWGYANAKIIDILNRIRPPFNINTPAQIAGAAAVYDQAFVQESANKNNKARADFCEGLKNLGFKYIQSYANFVSVCFNNAEQAFNLLQDNGIIVRQLDSYGMPDYLRITIGTAEQMKKIINILAKI